MLRPEPAERVLAMMANRAWWITQLTVVEIRVNERKEVSSRVECGVDELYGVNKVEDEVMGLKCRSGASARDSEIRFIQIYSKGRRIIHVIAGLCQATRSALKLL